MTDYRAWLQAAAEDLRATDDAMNGFAGRYDSGGPHRALADLIDGITGRHFRDAEAWCDHCIEKFPCPDLVDLAAYISTIVGRPVPTEDQEQASE